MWTVFVFEGVLVMILGGFGILGNCVLVGLFVKLRNKLNFHRLMITLAIYDIIYILLCIIVFAVPQISEEYKTQGYHFYIAPKSVPMMQIALTGSVYCTVSVSFERYMAVCHPFLIAGKNWSAKRYIIPIVVFSVLYNAAHFFEMRTKYIGFHNQSMSFNATYAESVLVEEISEEKLTDENSISSFSPPRNDNYVLENCQSATDNFNQPQYKYKVELTMMRKNKYYYSIYIIGLNFVFNGLIPFTILITLNSLLYYRMKSIVSSPSFKSSRLHSTVSIAVSQQQQQSFVETVGTQDDNHRIKLSEIVLTKVSIAIVCVFIVCQSVKWIPNIYELIQRLYTEDDCIKWPFWVESITQISHFLTVLSSSVNFYIYCVTHYGIPSNLCLRQNQQTSDIQLRGILK